MTHDFLVEIGTEELPPKALNQLQKSFAATIRQGLESAELNSVRIKDRFAAPRRLAVLVEGLEAQAPNKEIVAWGPPSKIAFDDQGAPTKAAIAFANKNGIDPSDLVVENDGKQDKLVHRFTQQGQSAAELLPAIVAQALDKLPIPKRMRWGASRTEFVRPVHWVVMLLGSEVIDCEILGITSGRTTRGHRFHCNQELSLANASDYQLTLEEQGYVVVDFDERRGKIREQVEAEGAKLSATAVIDEDLLDEVTGLVEWPVALTGSFEERFLEVPAEALISSMAEHQKYFHLVDEKGALLPNFITISNIESTDPSQVIDGNERVIRPRLADAAFFFETDKKTPLEQRCEKLKSIVFQEKLGTVFEKTQRIQSLASEIAQRIGSDPTFAARAGQLCKADLASEMVLEFDKMQGIAGQYYALHDREESEVAGAIKDHYLPKFAGDELPHSLTGCAVALADRLDTLVGIFGIGQPPTGSRDPFALRRATLGILRIIIEKGLDLDLRELLTLTQQQFGDALSTGDNLVDTILDYMIERFRAWYEDEQIPVEVFFAVSAKKLSQPVDINQRVHAVNRFNQLPESQALAAANKRVSNILAKQAGEVASTVDNSLLQEAAEVDLAAAVAAKLESVTPLFQQRQYAEGLESLAELRAPVDRFFDDVMVMADDEALRNNRLALLSQLRNLFLEVADISLLVPAK